jgi:hypothetical protein
MEKHQIGAALFAKVGELLLANGMKLLGGTIVDATLIAAPPSTKNRELSRDPEMHQSRYSDRLLGGRSDFFLGRRQDTFLACDRIYTPRPDDFQGSM